ncbi:aryl hydrocarbon receptor repressor-like [Scleropages formosus]|uniref:Aryl hydrocarbon receptor repressor n=2 Tax=Scleropages formosus TaxID=113540 RepID=A0A8C9RP64_SCLFO|nr:aryl hydrocarbon receptor repressor-like [Scleropages formosus]
MIPPGDCMYAGRKRRKPIQKQKPAVVSEKSNPSKRHRDRLNAELDRLASLLPFSPDVISKLDKLSVLRLSVSYLRVKSFFQAIQEKPSRIPISPSTHPDMGKESQPGPTVAESELLLESLTGFALVVSTDGMVFYASSTIVDYLGFHQTDVMHQNIFDYIHVDDRQEFRRQLHWAMNPTQQLATLDPHLVAGAGEDFAVNNLFNSPESGGIPPEYSSFLNRCFISRVRCLLDSTSGFLTMQFQGRLKFLYGQKKKTPSGTALPPQLALFCVAVPLLLPSITEMKMKTVMMRGKQRSGLLAVLDHSEREEHLRRPPGHGGEALLLSCPGNPGGPARSHGSWTALAREGTGTKCKSEVYYAQEEPLNFCKSSTSGHRAPGFEQGMWTARATSGAVRVGQNISYIPSRLGKPGAYRMSPNCHPARNDIYLPKLYNSPQNLEVENFCVESIKSENRYMPPGEGYDGRLLPEMPIKVEQDSDSENGCDIYGIPHGRAWTYKEHMEKRYGTGYDGLQLKTEAEYYEQFSPCQKSKAVSPTFNGHYPGMCITGSRPLKCVLNKDLSQFSPQRLVNSDPLCSHQSANCMESHMHGEGPMDHKSYAHQDYKFGYDFKGHGLLHSIKREPMDSPPWSDGANDINYATTQRNVMSNCVMSAGAHKSNPYIYMQ